MRDSSSTGFRIQTRSNCAWSAMLAALVCGACFALSVDPARADAIALNSEETAFGTPVSLEDLDNERARFAAPGEPPVDVRGFAVILMDELGKPTGSAGSVVPGAGTGTVALGGSRTN